MPSRKGKIAKALEKRRKVQHGGVDLSGGVSIMIANEFVLLDDTTVAADSVPDKVLFSRAYIPGGSLPVPQGLNDAPEGTLTYSYDLCVKTFHAVFGGPIKMSLEWAYFPDNPHDRSIIEQGLLQRFRTLSDEIVLYGTVEQNKASLATRISKLNALRELINAAYGSTKYYNYVSTLMSDAENTATTENETADDLARIFALLYVASRDKDKKEAEEVLDKAKLSINQDDIDELNGVTSLERAVALLGVLKEANISRGDFILYLTEWSERNKAEIPKLPPSMAEIISKVERDSRSLRKGDPNRRWPVDQNS
jgi:hypothetical protein